MKIAYLDNAAATPLREEVFSAMLPYLKEEFGNPSTIYDLGTRVKDAIENARGQVASLIGAKPEEIIFTSSGAEANNLAIKGVALARLGKKRHIVVSSIDHHSVLNSARFLERLDFEVTFLPVDKYGIVDLEKLKSVIREETALVSIGFASNEIGTIQPIKEAVDIAHEKGILFHTDAVAALGSVPIDVNELDVDLLTISSIPLGAPKGVGALYFKNGLRLMPLIHGGIQERGRRAGTENVPGIVGLGKAAEITKKELDIKPKKLEQLRNKLISGVLEKVPSTVLTGHPRNRLPGHASFCFEAIEGEALVFLLSQEGIYGNTGSACASKALKTSPVLAAIGIDSALAQGSLVFTLDYQNTIDDIEYVLTKLPPLVEKLRGYSPLWNKKEN